MSEPTVGAGFARGLFDLAVARGAGPAALAEQSGVDPAALRDQDARLAFSRYAALMRAGQALTGDPALALHYGEAVDIAEVSVIGLIGQASATMMDAFTQLNRYVPLVVETLNEAGGPRFRLAPDPRGLWLVDARLDPNGFPELTESAFAQLVCGPRRLGDGPALKAATFTWPDPGYGGEYARILGTPARFGCERNGLLIDAEWLGHQVERLPSYAFGVLTRHADGLLGELEAARSVRGEVERRLLPVLHAGAPGMRAVAAQLGVSRQTLFRRLKAEGVTFEQVLDDLRRRLALDYLAGRKVSVNETAYLVGFSEPAAFSRAFKRWTGRNPRDLRG